MVGNLKYYLRKSAPKLKMEGTHNPTKSPASFCPVNHKYTANKNEIPAATINIFFITFKNYFNYSNVFILTHL